MQSQYLLRVKVVVRICVPIQEGEVIISAFFINYLFSFIGFFLVQKICRTE